MNQLPVGGLRPPLDCPGWSKKQAEQIIPCRPPLASASKSYFVFRPWLILMMNCHVEMNYKNDIKPFLPCCFSPVLTTVPKGKLRHTALNTVRLPYC